MRKFLILAAVLLFGVGSVFAQGAWDVVVTWGFSASPVCEFEDLQNDRFLVFITIYDKPNDIIVVDNMGNVEANTASQSVFDVQTAVQAHCNDNTLQHNPGFIIYAKVRMVNTQTEEVYCSEKSTDKYFYCSNFSSGYIQTTYLLFN